MTPANPSQPNAKQLADMVRRIARTQDEEYDCEITYQLFDQFTEAVARGEDIAEIMPRVQHHLDMCPDCKQEFEALLKIIKVSLP